MIKTLSPEPWQDYELVDSGHFEKLERFGKFTLRRPEPQAIWSPSLSEEEWKKRAFATFEKGKSNPESGNWVLKQGMPDKWINEYKREELKIKYKLSLSSFKHVGIFPEQSVNWDFLFSKLTQLKRTSNLAPLALNLFAYTGIASVVCKAAGADITHLDSIKQVVTWARENMEASGLDGIRWMVDDALKFALREERRGKKYQCLILDPPAYGRGPDGEKWILEEHLPGLLKACKSILDPENHVFVLNLYSLGFSTLITENLIKEYFPKSKPELGEIYLEDGFGKKLPLGTFARFSSF